MITGGSGSSLNGQELALRNYWQALAKRATTPVDYLFVGDSLTEGAMSSTRAGRWVERMMTSLRAQYQPAGIVGGEGYIPAAYIGTSFGSSPWVMAGGATAGAGFGLGQRSATLTGSVGVQTATMTITCTGLDIHYLIAPLAGTMGIQVDGGTLQTVNCNGSEHDGGVFTVRGLSAGAHTVVITYQGGSGTNVYLEGAMVYNGDEASGLRFWEAGHSGLQCSSMATNPATEGFYMRELEEWIGIIKPDIIFLQQGSNDINVGRTAGQFAADIQTVMSGLIGAITTPTSVIVMKSYNTEGKSLDQWVPFNAAIVAAAQANTNASVPQVGVLDLSLAFGDVVANSNGLLQDNTHPNDLGCQYWSDIILSFIAQPQAVQL